MALFLIQQSDGLFLRIYGFLHTFQDANLERGIHRCGFRIKADGCHFNLECPHVSRLQIFHFRQLMQQTLCIGGELKGGFRLDFKIPKHEFIHGDSPAAIGIHFFEATLQSFFIYYNIERGKKLGEIIRSSMCHFCPHRGR